MMHPFLFLGSLYLVYAGLSSQDYGIAIVGLLVAFTSAETLYEARTGKNFGLGRKPPESLEALRKRGKREVQQNIDT